MAHERHPVNSQDIFTKRHLLYDRTLAGHFAHAFKAKDYDLSVLREELNETQFTSSCSDRNNPSDELLSLETRSELVLESIKQPREGYIPLLVTVVLSELALITKDEADIPTLLFVVASIAISGIYCFHRARSQERANRLHDALQILVAEEKLRNSQTPQHIDIDTQSQTTGRLATPSSEPRPNP